jgi:hypothetical protein
MRKSSETAALLLVMKPLRTPGAALTLLSISLSFLLIRLACPIPAKGGTASGRLIRNDRPAPACTVFLKHGSIRVVLDDKAFAMGDRQNAVRRSRAEFFRCRRHQNPLAS